MKLTVLVDNFSNNTEMLTEHGLSIYLEADGLKCLFDTGASDKFIKNAEKLKINISDVDYLIISHAHSDHTGGLENFIENNDKAKIFLSSQISGASYFSTRNNYKKNISIDYSIIKKNQKRFEFIDSNLNLSQNITLLNNIPNIFETPKGNKTLFVNDQQDDFRHEIGICINTHRGAAVISACSHHGILNTLAAVQNPNINIIAYIGGSHLLDSTDSIKYETDEELINIINKINSLYPELTLITGHCTGANAKKQFSEKLKNNFLVFYSGFTFEI